MNKWQRIVCQTYASGDFAYLADDPNWETKFRDVGDTLFVFLMIELADKEDCDSDCEAIRRLGVARDQLLVVLDKLIAAS